jgi:hypothetical protein
MGDLLEVASYSLFQRPSFFTVSFHILVFLAGSETELLSTLSAHDPLPQPTIILWRINPLLGRDFETYEYIRCYAIGNKQMAISEQWFGKHILAETFFQVTLGCITTLEGLLEAVFSVRPAPRLCSEDLKLAHCSSVERSEEAVW